MSSPMSKKFSHGIMECPFCHKEFKSLGIASHRARCREKWLKAKQEPDNRPVPIQVSARFRPGKDWWDEKEERACQEISKMADERKK